MTSRLLHPLIIAVEGAIVDPPRIWFVLEMAARGSLRSALSSKSLQLTYATPRLFRIVVDVMRAMHYLSAAAGVLHRHVLCGGAH